MVNQSNTYATLTIIDSLYKKVSKKIRRVFKRQEGNISPDVISATVKMFWSEEKNG